MDSWNDTVTIWKIYCNTRKFKRAKEYTYYY